MVRLLVRMNTEWDCNELSRPNSARPRDAEAHIQLIPTVCLQPVMLAPAPLAELVLTPLAAVVGRASAAGGASLSTQRVGHLRLDLDLLLERLRRGLRVGHLSEKLLHLEGDFVALRVPQGHA